MQKKTTSVNQPIYRKPGRIFEASGTVNPEGAYYVRLDNVTNTYNQDIKTMVNLGRYFSIFAPRQSGKTTFLEAMRDELHANPTYAAVILCFQDYKNLDIPEFYSLIEAELYEQLVNRLKEINCEKTEAVDRFLKRHRLVNHISFRLLFEELNRIIEFKKIVVFIDEFDGIPLSELENFLTSLRKLYLKYKKVEKKALYSIGLIGIRDITKLIVGGVSPFNIADQVDLPPFSLQNVHDLYAQYTEETNQPFSEKAVKKVHEETQGQTWLVNRLGTILTIKIKPETVDSIDEQDVEKAIQNLLIERNDHFDNLYEKAKLYKETFVKIVFNNIKYNPGNEDQTWLEQYGLIKKQESKAVVANNIYKKRYIETFFDEIEVPEDMSAAEYLLPGDRLDMERILLDFDQYIAQIGVRVFYKEKKPYEKTGQFLLTAWLYRFAKGDTGDLRYEVPSGLGRMDPAARGPSKGHRNEPYLSNNLKSSMKKMKIPIGFNFKGRKYIIETKVNHQDDMTRILHQGIKQVAQKYLVTESVHEGYLVIFDTKTHAGAVCKPQVHREGGKKVYTFIIGIRKNP